MCPLNDPPEDAFPHQLAAEERYWLTLTEEELLAAEFTTDDPGGLHNVVSERPDTDEIPIVEMAYDLRGTGRKVRCVHDRYENHARGIVMRYRDGRRILVGRDCAREIWGVNFDILIKDFDLAKDTAYYVRRRNAARAAAPRFLEALAALRTDRAIGLYQNLKIDFRRSLSNLAALIDELVDRHHGVLFWNEKVRDLDAEARRVVKENELEAPMTKNARRYLQGMRSQGEEPKKQLDPIFKTVTRPLGPIQGSDFFGGGTPAIGFLLTEFERRATGALHQLNEPHANLGELKKRLGGLTEIVDGILGEIGRLEGLIDAFEAGNLSRIVKWANSVSDDGTRYSVELGAIIAHPDRADNVVVRFPPDYRIPSREPFKTFRAAITG